MRMELGTESRDWGKQASQGAVYRFPLCRSDAILMRGPFGNLTSVAQTECGRATDINKKHNSDRHERGKEVWKGAFYRFCSLSLRCNFNERSL